MKLEKLTQNIFNLSFSKKYDLALTFVRFQEHYESQEFKGKIFSLKEFKKWYLANSKSGKKTGKFRYHEDWTAFNIPSKILIPFYQGKFNPLSDKEQDLLNLFKNKKGKFYIIGTLHGVSRDTTRHEIAHGLFYVNSKYRKRVYNILKKIPSNDLNELRDYILKEGYHPSVLKDEMHAYLLEKTGYFKNENLDITKFKDVRIKLRELFDSFSRIESFQD